MKRDLNNSLPTDIAVVMSDPSASFWVKTALQTALERDAVDAANDARMLADLLEQRAEALLLGHHCGKLWDAS